MAEQANKPEWLAGSRTIAGVQPFHLWAGEKALHTDHGMVGDDALTQYQVISRVGGKIVPYTGEADAEGNVAAPAGVTAVPAQPGDSVPYYTDGHFNHTALDWPAGLTTFEDRKDVFPPLSTIRIGYLQEPAANTTQGQ